MEQCKKRAIGIFAPANSMSKIDKRLVDLGVYHLNSLGFNVIFGEHVHNSEYYMAGTIEERVSDIHTLFENDEVFMLMAAYGGYNSNQLLDYIDYELIKRNPKPIIGYSDITALLNGVYAKTDIPMLHGPSFISFCNPTQFPEFVENFIQYAEKNQIITMNSPGYFASDAWYLKEDFGPREICREQEWHFLREGDCSGLLVGGNIETFASLIGTDYLPNLNSKILLLEAVGDNAAAIDRYFTQMKQAGIFSKLNGLLIGQFSQSSPLHDATLLNNIIHSCTDHTHYPILINTHFSHVDPIYTIPIGADVSIISSPTPQIIVQNISYDML